MKEDDSTIIWNKKDRTLTIDSISAHDYDEICLINSTLFTADRQKNTNEIKKNARIQIKFLFQVKPVPEKRFQAKKWVLLIKKGLLASSWELKVKTKIDNSWADAVLELYRMKCRPRHIILPPTHTNRKDCDKIMVYGKLDCTYSI